MTGDESRNFFEDLLFNSTYFKGNAKSNEELSESYARAISGFTLLFGNDFYKMLEYDQKAPHHDRNLWSHTLKFISSIPSYGKAYNLSPEELKLLTIVGFFHDFGKPDTMTIKRYNNVPLLPDNHPARKFQTPTGNGLSDVEVHSFGGHAEKSRILTMGFMRLLNYPLEESNRIEFLVAHHDDFMRIRTVDEASIENMAEKVNHLIQDAMECKYNLTARDLQLMILIGKCDSAAQAEYVYEFDKDKNSFPPQDQPSDSLTRKIDTYDEIERHFPQILQATDDLIINQYQDALGLGIPDTPGIATTTNNLIQLFGDRMNVLHTIQNEFRSFNNQSLEEPTEPSLE